jgi:RNA polymerase sigma-70 factor, ECF subfamily
MAERDADFEARLLAQADTIAAIAKALLPQGRYDPDDLVQEVILRAWAHHDRLRDPARLPQWVAIIARNTARDWARRPTPANVDDLPDSPHPGASASDRVERQERLKALERALRTLDDTDRSLLLARYRDDTPYDDLEEQTGLSYAAVTTRVHRARERVRRLIGAAVGAVSLATLAPRTRAFGAIPRRTGGGSTVVTVTAAIVGVVIGSVGVGLSHQAGDATAEAPRTMAVAETRERPRRPASVSRILDAMRMHDGGVDTYVATFSERRVSMVGVENPRRQETLTEGIIRRRGDHMAAELTETRWRLEGDERIPSTEQRKDVASDAGLMVTKTYWESAPPSTRIDQTPRFRLHDLFTDWRPGGEGMADYLARLVDDPAREVSAESVDIDGAPLYHVVAAGEDDARWEYLVDPARGYRVVRRVYVQGDHRSVTEIEPRHVGGDVWYPASVSRATYERLPEGGERPEPTWVSTLDITSFSVSEDVPDSAFGAIPAPGNAFYDAIRTMRRPGG